MFPLGARLVYGDAHVLSADAREVATLTRQYTVSDVRRLHAQYYHPATTALVVVGDVTGAEVHGLAQAAFGDWAPPGPPPRPAALPKPARKSRKPGATIHLVYGGSANSYLLVLAPGPAHSAPDHEAAILFTKILGGMFESRAMTALRHRAGASYGAVAEVGALAEHGLLGFWSSVDRLRTPFAVEWLLEEATRLREELVSEDELSLARAERIAHLTDALSSNAETATLISRLFVAGHRDPAAYLRELPGRLARIRPEDVRAAARRYLDPERLDIIVWGSRSLHRRLSEIAHVEAYE
jgi:zinc protease